MLSKITKDEHSLERENGTDVAVEADMVVGTVLEVVVVDIGDRNWAQVTGLEAGRAVAESFEGAAAMRLDGRYCSAVTVVKMTVGEEIAASDSRSVGDIAVDLPRRVAGRAAVCSTVWAEWQDFVDKAEAGIVDTVVAV